jgi:hypothetical protein
MIDPQDVPDVEPQEMLARFIFSNRHIRSSSDTIKPDAFVPHPHTELSAMRHRDAMEHEIWVAGRAIATYQNRTMHGRGDVTANVFLKQDLVVQADPILGHADLPDNPNHANVSGWPRDDKARQRLIALKIAAQARLVHTADQ